MPITEIPTRRNFDGNAKLYTKDCFECPFYRKIDELEICGWGVRFKYLTRTDSPRKCEFRNKVPPKYPSFVYLDNLDLEKLRTEQEKARKIHLEKRASPVQTKLPEYPKIV